MKNEIKIPFKIYPSRMRPFLAFIIGTVLGVLVIVYRERIPAETPWFMYAILYGLPLLAIIAGLKNSLFPAPQIIVYEEGLSYPKIGLKMLPWEDIMETRLQQKATTSRGRVYFSPTESDRCLEIKIAKGSAACGQIKLPWRMLLRAEGGDDVVLPIGLMG